MPANQLYHTWSDRIRQLRPEARKTLVHNFTWLLIGIYLSRKVHLSAIANQLPGSAKLHSTVQRLRRLLQHGICVRKWYGPIGEALLKSQARHGPIRLIVDGTKVSFHHRLLMVSIAFRRRAIPIVWTWVKSKRGHSAVKNFIHCTIPLEKSSCWEAAPFGRSSLVASEADLTYHQGTIPMSSRLSENELDRRLDFPTISCTLRDKNAAASQVDHIIPIARQRTVS